MTGLLLYTLFGGLIFNLVERPAEIQSILDSQEIINSSIAEIVDVLVNSSNLTVEEAQNVTQQILALGSRVAEATEGLNLETTPIWDFSSAIFFASTVITTIGMTNFAENL